ncbi:MAG: amino acid adenylation domain-containing protein, partial [bacterium]|nr:amino acid adenylation domain-containing protein [bacterium]
PDYPEERIRYMLKDSGSKVIVTDGLMVDGLGGLTVKDPGDAGQLPNRQTDLAYIIYTSGSTGHPKGVVVEQSSLVNLVFDLQRRYPFGETDTYLLKTNFVFDVSLSELMGWFIGGGRLAVLEREAEKDPPAIVDGIGKFGVTHINFVPTMFNVFAGHLTPANIHRLSGLKYIFLAGEALPAELVKRFRQLGTGILLENLYGPTEATVYASLYSLGDWTDTAVVPIGKPLGNVRLYILDRYSNLQAVGIPGELCIAGAGVARGYLNRPELTREKFEVRSAKCEVEAQYHCKFNAAKPRKAKESERSELYDGVKPHHNFALRTSHFALYHTGDLARWMTDGNIEFLGRIDHQVKIRGFRIELGEIESGLLKQSNVIDAVVIDREDSQGERYLCAYVVYSDPSALPDLREYLSGSLPQYMVPSYFVRLDEIPSTVGGKVDRNALPAPELQAAADRIAPSGPVEIQL